MSYLVLMMMAKLLNTCLPDPVKHRREKGKSDMALYAIYDIKLFSLSQVKTNYYDEPHDNIRSIFKPTICSI